MICVTTRFRLKHFWQLIPMWFLYRRLQRGLKIAPGLMRHAFVLESPLVLYTFSIWESNEAIVRYTNDVSHIYALRKSKQMCQDIWSAYWTISAMSKFALSWPGIKAWPTFVPDPKHHNRLIPTVTKVLAQDNSV